MKHSLASVIPSALVVLVSVAFAPLARAGDKVVTHKFHKPPVNSLGITSLEELRGKPVLVDFWGTHCPPCIGFAVPTAVKLQEQYGDALQVIFVESQGATLDQYEAFAWRMKWMGNRAMWTTEPPLRMIGNGLPESALIGVDGRVLMQGNPGDLGSKLEDAIAAEVKKSKEPPADAPAALKKAWSAFMKGDVAVALAECDKVGTDEARATREQFVASSKRRVTRAKWMIDNGYVVEAEKFTDELAKSVKGCTDLEPLVAAQAARLNAPEMVAERDAQKAVTLFLDQIAKKKPFDDANVQRAESLGKKYSGTKSGERATRLAQLAKVNAPD